MGNFWRAVVTAFIWLMCAIMGTVSVSAGGFGGEWVVVPVLIAALIATAIVWVSEALTANAQARSSERLFREAGGASPREKAKRDSRSDSDRIALLLEMMDADEREEFKNILKRRVLQDTHLSDDGEFFAETSLKSLMQEDEERLRREQ